MPRLATRLISLILAYRYPEINRMNGVFFSERQAFFVFTEFFLF